MYLHIGAETSVRDSDLVGIFDLDGQMTTADTAAFLRAAEKRKITRTADDAELPKCFLLLSASRCGKAGRRRRKRREEVLFTPISAAALKGRFQSGIL